MLALDHLQCVGRIDMDFMTAVKTCLTKKYATFSGRALRSEYWFFYLFIVLGGIAATIIDVVILGRFVDDFGPIHAIFTLATFLPVIAAGARRLHDNDRSGWWQLIIFIPVVGVIVLIVFMATKGTESDNRFGTPPRMVPAPDVVTSG
jgi:uncharacterized membrane protein YhaH (DUF805 family)